MEHPLSGGNTTPGVVRVGDTVRRPRGRHSDDARRALLLLEDRGFAHAPRYLGVDAEDRDILTWIDGATTSHPLERDERAYRRMGEILRLLHDLTAEDPLAGAGRVLLHGDPGPFNVVCREGMPIALIDWDTAHRGDRMDDLGYAAWTWCLLDDPRIPVADQARRVRELRDGYDPGISGPTVLHAMENSQLGVAAGERLIADDESASESRRAHARRAVAWADGAHRLLTGYRAEFESAFD